MDKFLLVKIINVLEFYSSTAWTEREEEIDLRETTAIFHNPEKVLKDPIIKLKRWVPRAKLQTDHGTKASNTLKLLEPLIAEAANKILKENKGENA